MKIYQMPKPYFEITDEQIRAAYAAERAKFKAQMDEIERKHRINTFKAVLVGLGISAMIVVMIMVVNNLIK